MKRCDDDHAVPTDYTSLLHLIALLFNMGIKGEILKNLPGGRKEDYQYGLQKLGLNGYPVNFDAAGFIHYCARRYEERYHQKDYDPSAKVFQEFMVYLTAILRWDLWIFFDGKDPAWKDAEHQRRYGKEGEGEGSKLRNSSTFIALCTKICASLQIPFVVSVLEADTQIVKWRREMNPVVACDR